MNWWEIIGLILVYLIIGIFAAKLIIKKTPNFQNQSDIVGPAITMWPLFLICFGYDQLQDWIMKK